MHDTIQMLVVKTVSCCVMLCCVVLCRQASLQYHLLSCVESLTLVAKDDCTDISLSLFSLLITVLALQRADIVKDQVRLSFTNCPCPLLVITMSQIGGVCDMTHFNKL